MNCFRNILYIGISATLSFIVKMILRLKADFTFMQSARLLKKLIKVLIKENENCLALIKMRKCRMSIRNCLLKMDNRFIVYLILSLIVVS